MRRKKIVLILILCFIGSSLIFSNITKLTESYTPNTHQWMIKDGLFLLNRDWLKYPYPINQDPDIKSMKNCYTELDPTATNNDLYDALIAGNNWADKHTVPRDQHFWSPSELEGIHITSNDPGYKGAPYWSNFYFTCSVYLYLLAEQNIQSMTSELDDSIHDMIGFPVYRTDLYADDLVDTLNAYGNNYERAYHLFGISLHIMQDVSCALHAVNTYGEAHIPGDHIEVENKLRQYYDDQSDVHFLTGNEGSYGAKEDWEGNFNTKGWIHQTAWLGEGNYSIITELPINNPDFISAVDFIYRKTVSFTAGFIFYFWQIIHSYPGQSSYTFDFDKDNIGIRSEQYYHTDYALEDTDFDGIIDGDEVDIYLQHPIYNWYDDIDQDGLLGCNDWDADGDTLSDGEEFNVLLTDLLDYDTDSDGLHDGVEVNTYYTNPCDDDTDSDGYDDYQEIIVYGTDPLDSLSNPAYLWMPESVNGFTGIPNQVSKITFVWQHPANHQPGWYYKIWRKPKYYGSYVLVSTTNIYTTTFQDYPPSVYTTYTYRIACFNLNVQQGSYSYWEGRVKSQGGGGGGGG